MTELTKQEAYAELEQRVQRVYEALDDACNYADKHKLSFHFSPTYGMGGQYVGDPVEYKEAAEWRYDLDESNTTGWCPSSGSC